MRALIFNSRAACATAAPWLPPEAATTPASGTRRNKRLAKAPRALNEPDCCRSSSLKIRVMLARPKSPPSTSMVGVRRMCGRMTGSVAAISSLPTLERFTEHPARLGDALLVAAVEGPLLDPLRLNEPQGGEELEVFVRARFTHAELVGDEQAAHAIFHQISIDLGREVCRRLLQPVEDGQAPLVGQRCRNV